MKDTIKYICFSYALNLSIMNRCNIEFERNAFGIITEIINLFNISAKISYILINTLKSSLYSLCEIRWMEKHD